MVALDPRGGLAGASRQAPRGLAAVRPPIDLPSSVERLATLLVALAIAKADKHAGRPSEKTPKAIKDQIMRLRKSMVAASPEAAELAGAVTLALSGQGGRILRTAEQAHVDARSYAMRSGALFATFVLNGMRIPMALVRAGSSAMNEALADLLRDHLVRIDPTVGIAVTRTRDIDGSKVRSTVPTFDALLKLYNLVSTAARQDAIAALHLEKEGREEERQQAHARRMRRVLEATKTPTPRPALEQGNTTSTPALAELVKDDAERNGCRSVVGEHGAPADHSRNQSAGADDLRDVSTPERSPGATSTDREPSADAPEEPSDAALKAFINDQVWDKDRKRMVPARIHARPIPNAAAGADWKQRQDDEAEELRRWEREHSNAVHQLKMRGMKR